MNVSFIRVPFRKVSRVVKVLNTSKMVTDIKVNMLKVNSMEKELTFGTMEPIMKVNSKMVVEMEKASGNPQVFLSTPMTDNILMI